VLAPNSPLRTAVTARTLAATNSPRAPNPEPAAEGRRAARYICVVLVARNYEVLPLVCPICEAEMRVFAFITAAERMTASAVHQPKVQRKLLMKLKMSGRSIRCEYATPVQLWLATKELTARMRFVPPRRSGPPESPKQTPPLP
jgi:hypothetical protein